MKGLFLQDLFSNFMLAMVVLAVIAMRTQSRDVTEMSYPEQCKGVNASSSIDEVGLNAIITLTDSSETTLPIAQELRSVISLEMILNGNFVAAEHNLLPPVLVSVLSQGCVRAQFVCKDKPPEFKKDSAKIGGIVQGCALDYLDRTAK